jgi:hypothetical protein
MGKRKNPWTAIGFSKYEGFHGMPFDLRSRGQTHELNRERVVSSILRELYVMATLGIIQQYKIVSVKRAISQNLRGSKSDMTEAAHCCPRQVMIGDKTPTEILQTAFPERAFVLNAFFAESDILPANFNKADTRAEGNGLSNGFRAACNFIIKDAHYKGKLEYEPLMTAVRTAYSIFKEASEDAFRVSIERLESKLRFNVTKKDEIKWTEQIKILKIYSRTLKRSSGASVVLDITSVNGLIKIYNEMGGKSGVMIN